MSNPLGIEFEDGTNSPAASPEEPKKQRRARDPEAALDEQVIQRTRAVQPERQAKRPAEEPMEPQLQPPPPPPQPQLPRPAPSSPLDPRLAALSQSQRRLVGELVLSAWPFQRERMGNDQLVDGAMALVRHLDRVGLLPKE